MALVCGVRFRGAGKVYHFDPLDVPVAVADYVIVATARGDEMGQVTEAPHDVTASQIVGELKPVLRKASANDIARAEQYREKEIEAVTVCQEHIGKVGLQMKVVSAEFSYDGSRLTFYFTAENRVDFRALVRDLARTFRARIDLRQIGVRDEAKLVGGLGPCGRPLCCATWLTQFSPVSIRMAKQQNLPLSPMEISGLCGRLLCCLTYENDYYREVRGMFPKVGRTVDTPYGRGKVIKVSVLRETVTLLLEDGSTAEMTADQLSGAEPMAPRDGAVEGASLTNSLRKVAAPAQSSEQRPERGQGSNPRGQDRSQRSRGASRQADSGQSAQDAQGARRPNSAPNSSRPAAPQNSGENSQNHARPGQDPDGASEQRSRRSRGGRSGRRRTPRGPAPTDPTQS